MPVAGGAAIRQEGGDRRRDADPFQRHPRHRRGQSPLRRGPAGSAGGPRAGAARVAHVVVTTGRASAGTSAKAAGTSSGSTPARTTISGNARVGIGLVAHDRGRQLHGSRRIAERLPVAVGDADAIDVQGGRLPTSISPIASEPARRAASAIAGYSTAQRVCGSLPRNGRPQVLRIAIVLTAKSTANRIVQRSRFFSISEPPDGAARDADAERAGHARVLAGVQQHEEDHAGREEDLNDTENRVEHAADQVSDSARA